MYLLRSEKNYIPDLRIHFKPTLNKYHPSQSWLSSKDVVCTADVVDMSHNRSIWMAVKLVPLIFNVTQHRKYINVKMILINIILSEIYQIFRGRLTNRVIYYSKSLFRRSIA